MEQQQIDAVYDIMMALDQTALWSQMVRKDPYILMAEEKFFQVLGTKDPNEKICQALTQVIDAHTTVAMLYGMQIAISLQSVMQAPSIITGEIVKHIKEAVMRNGK